MTEEKKHSVLDRINSPADLKKITSKEEMRQLCEEIRGYILEVLSKGNGHLGSALGVVELSVALHYVFNTPDDKIIWDVGHQAYAHKILTGRKKDFQSNRQFKGISGFPKRSESEYDAFGTGHSSTSVSAALGMAIASKLEGNKNRQHIAVIGDGSLSGGMAFEALNHSGDSDTNILIIINDNGISIDKGVGALKKSFTNITSSHTYNKIKRKIWQATKRTWFRKFVNKFNNAIKSALLKKSNYFETLNLRYFGPVNGHDLPRLVFLLDQIKDIPGPKVLHCVTVKGKGFPQAEIDQTRFHAPGKFDVETGILIKDEDKKPPRFQDVFGETIIELAEKNEKIIGITPAMGTGCSLNLMMQKMPERTFDVGIAEQHAVTFAAGMAAQGFIPFCNIYSTFMQRAYDQLIHDVALQKLPVIFCIDRGGLVGEDGPTHHGAFDLAYLHAIPNIIISAPIDEIELRNLMFTAQSSGKTFAIRYPRGRGSHLEWKKPMKAMEIGKGYCIEEGKDIAVLSIGEIGKEVIEARKILAKENICFAHYNMVFLKPIDEELLQEVFSRFSTVICIEDGSIIGGFASAVSDYASFKNYPIKIIKLGIADEFIIHGSIPQLRDLCGISSNKIAAKIKELKSKAL
jgi:1-deoxy-D-xylulose-5-phosphate synthase